MAHSRSYVVIRLRSFAVLGSECFPLGAVMPTLESKDCVVSERTPIALATLPIAFFDLLAPKPSAVAGKPTIIN